MSPDGLASPSVLQGDGSETCRPSNSNEMLKYVGSETFASISASANPRMTTDRG